MNTAGVIPTEAGDRDSFESVRIFQAQYATRPWAKAEVDRFSGLRLYELDGDRVVTVLHFAHCLCGYNGSGPMATAEILNAAGFGSTEQLMPLISANAHYAFTR